MKALLFHLDGKLPNLALMRIAAHHRALGDDVELRRTGQPERRLWDDAVTVYGSAIFEKSAPIVKRLRNAFPDAAIGGTGIDASNNLASVGITTLAKDYSIYPTFPHSIGYTQRGCRLRCSFCVVPIKEGAVQEEQSICDIWRGEPYPRNLLLLDNDFFGQGRWRERIREIQDGGFRVCLSQGINARFLTDETAEALASIDYRDDQFKKPQIYTAWDNRKDQERLTTGLERLFRAGVKPDHVMVYMLIGYWPGETDADWEARRTHLRALGCRPYPMPYVRNSLTVGFQRFCLGAYDKRFTWAQWKEANCRAENMRPHAEFPIFEEVTA